MSKGKYAGKGRKNNSGKLITLLLTLTLVLTLTIGGTLAWLTAQTTQVENTFSTSDIAVNFKETTSDYKMVPGWTIPKDPKAWVETGSEDAYLFVKVTKSSNFDTYMTYGIASGWTELESAADTDQATGATYKVYYREVVGGTQMGETNASYILKDNQVAVKDTVTKELMNDLTDATRPTLSFKAYAIQLYKSNTEKFEPAAAWTQVNAAANAG